MADAGSALSGAAAGAAAGSVVPGWGTAIGAGLGLLSSLMAGDGGAGYQRDLAAANIGQQQNDARYMQSLNAEALRRASAGSSDSFGTTTQYDPYTNTWKAMLGQQPEQAQSAAYGANTIRGAVDTPRASYGNEEAASRASRNNAGTSGALNELNSFRGITGEAERGALQDDTLRANNATYRPLVADTLRQYSRTGTAAGPVLAQLGRSSADSLSRQMAQNTVAAQSAASNTNTANQGRLENKVRANVGAGTPGGSTFAPNTSEGPMALLTQLMGQRAATAAQPATSGAYSSAIGSNAGTNAAALGAKYPGNNLLDAQRTNTAGKYGTDLVDSLWGSSGGTASVASQISDWFNGTTPTGINNANINKGGVGMFGMRGSA